MVHIGEELGVLVNSQRRQLELGVKKSVDLFQLVKRYHQRWNSLKARVERRHSDIEAAMVKYDPANLGVAGMRAIKHQNLVCSVYNNKGGNRRILPRHIQTLCDN